jgi:adenosylcobinamide-GDP ribazoletransferase
MKSTFPLALTFLTKIPWPGASLAEPLDLTRSMFWYPWVGALLGLAYLAAWQGFSQVTPVPAAAALLLCFTVLLTGGLHLDGLADTVDGLGGGHNPDERLKIMKDSRVGAFGVMSLILVLLTKFACLLGAAEQGWQAEFILFPILSRWSMVWLAFLSPYARPGGGLGQAMTEVSQRVALGAGLSALVLAVMLLRFKGLALWAGAGVFIWLVSRFCKPTLGGVTGDVLGAANEMVEVLVLCGALIL